MHTTHRFNVVSVLALAAVALAALLAATGCKGDPRTEVLEERARWNVELRRWLVQEDGRIMLDTQITGPVSSSIETLTFRVEVLDADGGVLSESWLSADLTEIQRGTPTGRVFRIDGAEGADGVRIDLMRVPTDAEAERIRELQP